MDISLVRQRLADAIATGVASTPPLTALAYVPDAIAAPCIYTDDIEIAFDRTMARGLDQATFTMRLLCSRADDRAGQKLLDGYLRGTGPTSVKRALEAARGTPGQLALGGAADDLHVESVAAYRWFVVGEARYVGAEFSVRVIGSGT